MKPPTFISHSAADAAGAKPICATAAIAVDVRRIYLFIA